MSTDKTHAEWAPADPAAHAEDPRATAPACWR